MSVRFGNLIDRYIERIESAEIGPDTEVNLIFRWADEEGRDVRSTTESLVPRVTVRIEGPSGPDERLAMRRLAESAHLRIIEGNLRRLILDAPEGLVILPGWPSPVQIRDIDLAISEPV